MSSLKADFNLQCRKNDSSLFDKTLPVSNPLPFARRKRPWWQKSEREASKTLSHFSSTRFTLQFREKASTLKDDKHFGSTATSFKIARTLLGRK